MKALRTNIHLSFLLVLPGVSCCWVDPTFLSLPQQRSFGLPKQRLLQVQATDNDAEASSPLSSSTSESSSTPSASSFESSSSTSLHNSDKTPKWLAKSMPLSNLISKEELPYNFTLVSPQQDRLELKPNQRLVSIGDVHGDFNALVEFLTLAGVYNASAADATPVAATVAPPTVVLTNSTSNTTNITSVVNATITEDLQTNKLEEPMVWCGGDTILVQCGDILDRGYQELQCINLLAKLSQQATKVGGSVICLYGNHEPMNSMGLFQDATTDLEYENMFGLLVDDTLETDRWRIQYVGNQPARWSTYEPGAGILCSPFLSQMKVAVIVGRTLFVHAGLTKDHLQAYGDISNMNRQAKEWITTIPPQVKINNQGEFLNKQHALAEAATRQSLYMSSIPKFLMESKSPVWMRDYSFPNDRQPKNPNAQAMIDEVLTELDCDRMVMGHTVQRRINCALQGKAWRVDVGASRGVLSGTPEVLEIVKGYDGTESISVLSRPKRDIFDMADNTNQSRPIIQIDEKDRYVS